MNLIPKKELRSYQSEAIQAVKNTLQEGICAQLLVLATGLGKTFTAVKVCEEYKKVLWLTHSEELLNQSALAFIKEKFDESFYNHVKKIGYIEYVRSGGLFAGSDFKMGVVKASDFFINANVVMASAKTMHRRLHLIPSDAFDCVIVDEAHLSAALTWVKTISHFQPKLLLGLTATARREDNMLLGDIYDKIVYEYGIKEGIDNGYLCELDAVRVKTTISLDKVRTTAGELNQKDLSEEINTPERNQLVVSSYLKYCKGRQGIFYCVDVDHAIKLSEIFNEMGVSCRPVSGDEKRTPGRESIMSDFEQGKIMVLTNCMVLTAGVDIPNVGCIGQASPTKSLTKYIQSCGRGTRLKSEEYVKQFGQNCIILDFIDNTSRHNLVNAWELDKDKDPEDRVFISKEKRDKLVEERKRKTLLKIKREEDEVIKLLRIPKPKVNKSIRMKEPASEKQLSWISSLGYDVVNEHYTKEMCSQIIMDLPATEKQKAFLKYKGYDVDSVTVLTRGMVEAALSDFNKRESKKQPF